MERAMTKGISAGIVPAGKLAMDFVRFGETQHGAGDTQVERFATCVLGVDNPEANSGVFAVMSALIRGIAAKDGVEDADGEAVEACRKICDIMGWQPGKVA